MLRELSRELRRNVAAKRALAAVSTPQATVFEQRPVDDAPQLVAQLAATAAFTELHASLLRLNPEQQRAVFDTSPATLVRAQVGSGKTSVLVHKVLYLHLACGVPLDELCVLTFTNKAAGEIRDRLSASAISPARLIGTFHSVACELLRHVLPLETLGLSRDFSVLDSDGQLGLCRQLAAEHGLKLRQSKRVAKRLTEQADGELARLYDAEKRARGYLDFDDLLALSCQLLRASPPSPPRWIIVDEFQDCAPRELAFIRALSGPQTHLFAVGDPNQVIYSWRGSDPSLFDAFAAERRCVVHSLPRNYRSSGMILGGARGLLGGVLVGSREDGERIAVVRHHDALSEARSLAPRLKALHAAGLAYNRTAVLVRTRQQLATFRDVFAEHEVPVVCPVSAEDSEARGARWLLRLLDAALRPRCGAELRDVLTDDRYGWFRPASWPARAFAKHCALLPELDGAALVASHFAARGVRDERVQRLSELDAALPSLDAEGLFRQLDLAAGLCPTSADYAREVALCRKVCAFLLRYGDERGLSRKDGARAAAAALTLGGFALLDEAVAQDDAGVRLLTLHACKGLEFERVFISGVNEGLVPLDASSPDRYAEERRLLFVGLTRAATHVELSYHTMPSHRRARAAPSPFLFDLPASVVEWREASAPVVAAAAPSSPFAPGARVRHPRYGEGEIVRVEGGMVCCTFPRLGERSFAELLCPLTPL